MNKTMLIDAANPEEVRVCLLQNGKVEDFDFESATRKPLRGNIYLARVTRVEPSLQAAFVEFGGNRHGFLAFNEIHPDYYQIPVSDRRQIKDAEAEEAELASLLNIADGDDDGDDGGVEEVDAPKDDNEIDATGTDTSDEDEAEGDEPSSKLETGSAPQVSGSPSEIDHEGHAGVEADEDSAAPFETLATDDALEADDDQDFDGEVSTENDLPEAKTKSNSAPLSSLSRAELMDRYREARRKRARLLRNYKIQEVIKRRQILLIQAVKEERGNKGAALTTYLSLAGRYCVLMPNTARGGGISRKIPVAADRKRLRKVVDELDVPSGMGLIIRTAGAKRTKAEIKRDYEYLIRLWENIRTLTLKSIAPCLIYEEASLIKRAIRDLYDKDISQVLVEGDNGYREAKDFMKMLMPSHSKNVQPYKESTPLFLKFGVEPQLDAMYQPAVRLRSGGYIVINQTEALIAIDVNSGKATRERNIEQTALRTNLEAADEAARQCRLRDLAGLIVIDFIDMEEQRNNRTVEKRLKDALRTDRARIQVGRISTFGLLEMSRQRRRSGIIDGTTHACPTCGGAGAVRSHEMAALRILRTAEHEALSGRAGLLQIKSALDVTLYILNHKREWLKRIESQYGVTVEVIADQTKAGDNFEIERHGAKRDGAAEIAAEIVRADTTEAIEPDAEPQYELADEEAAGASPSEHGEERSGRRRRKRRKRRQDPSDTQPEQLGAAREAPEDGEEREPQPDFEADGNRDSSEEPKPRKRRRRGRRSGRRNGGPRTEVTEDSSGVAASEEQVEASNDQPFVDAIEAVNDDDTEPETKYERDHGAFSEEREFAASEPEREAPVAFDTSLDEDSLVAPAAIEERQPEKVEIAKSAAKKEPARKGWWQKAFGE